jgi:hypothetical protein
LRGYLTDADAQPKGYDRRRSVIWQHLADSTPGC